MDLATVKRIIEALADGVDPRTESAEVLRALHVAAAAIEQEIRKRERDSALPPNASRPWNIDDDNTLGDLFDSGRPVEDIAKTLQRTRGSVASRLVMLGKVPDRQSPFVANLHSTANGH
jgi:hypothetical protein